MNFMLSSAFSSTVVRQCFTPTTSPGVHLDTFSDILPHEDNITPRTNFQARTITNGEKATAKRCTMRVYVVSARCCQSHRVRCVCPPFSWEKIIRKFVPGGVLFCVLYGTIPPPTLTPSRTGQTEAAELFVETDAPAAALVNTPSDTIGLLHGGYTVFDCHGAMSWHCHVPCHGS